jgi:glyoxylase-like metal-dependent hydrolase (beta-lactamase superfamily II)
LFYDQETDLLYASKSVNWYSWEEQLKSLQKLIAFSFAFSFEWVMPGHGGWVHKEAAVIKKELEAFCRAL